MEEERKEKEEKQGGAGNLTSLERETIITYNNAENTANCFTLSLPVRRRLLQLAEEYPDEVHINKQEEDMIDVESPKAGSKSARPGGCPMNSGQRWQSEAATCMRNIGNPSRPKKIPTTWMMQAMRMMNRHDTRRA